MARKKEEKIKWSFKNILIGIVVVWFLIATLIEVPWRLIQIRYGFLPWIYKDTWGKGWKLWVFMAVYAGIETAILYALLKYLDGNTGIYAMMFFYALFFHWVWSSQWDED